MKAILWLQEGPHLWTELEERHCAVFMSACRGPSGRFSHVQQLLSAHCIHEGRDRRQCAHTAHGFTESNPENCIMKETTTQPSHVHL